jgi:hypothetical protein
MHDGAHVPLLTRGSDPGIAPKIHANWWGEGERAASAPGASRLPVAGALVECARMLLALAVSDAARENDHALSARSYRR